MHVVVCRRVVNDVQVLDGSFVREQPRAKSQRTQVSELFSSSPKTLRVAISLARLGGARAFLNSSLPLTSVINHRHINEECI